MRPTARSSIRRHIAPELIEPGLFGHENGGFAGASRRSCGRCELARGRKEGLRAKNIPRGLRVH
ncbi:MAG: sigma 54-interacting transcriptional regulator [Rhodomicrobium sp.]